MNKINVIGLDLAKNVFQIHGVDAKGHIMMRRQLKRAQVLAFFANLEPCLVGMEACGGFHYWAREIGRLGHSVRLAHYRELAARITAIEQQLHAWHRGNDASRRLAEIPGVGLLTATALVGTVGDAKTFRNGRALAAYLGLVPRQQSTGGKEKLLGISKRGDVYLRTLLVHGARAVVRQTQRRLSAGQVDERDWLVRLLNGGHVNRAAGAQANKTVRIAWALRARDRVYQPTVERTAVAA